MLKKEYKRILILCTVLVLLCIFAVAFYFQNLIYVSAFQFFEPDISVEKIEVPTEKLPLSEIENDERIEFNQSLMLINTEYKISDSDVFNITEYKNSGVQMNTCMVSAYEDLSYAVLSETGEKLYVSSHFRNKEDQAKLYAESPELATEPGASEHEAGLCLDIYVQYNAGDNFLKTDAGKFVNTKCHEYGFIIRYPHYGYSETGIRFEPWHIRYVGKIHADIIYSNRLTLEEYIFSLEENVFYSVENYIITRQRPEDGCILIPAGFETYTISPDNTGCYIVTACG